MDAIAIQYGSLSDLALQAWKGLKNERRRAKACELIYRAAEETHRFSRREGKGIESPAQIAGYFERLKKARVTAKAAEQAARQLARDLERLSRVLHRWERTDEPQGRVAWSTLEDKPDGALTDGPEDRPRYWMWADQPAMTAAVIDIQARLASFVKAIPTKWSPAKGKAHRAERRDCNLAIVELVGMYRTTGLSDHRSLELVGALLFLAGIRPTPSGTALGAKYRGLKAKAARRLPSA